MNLNPTQQTAELIKSALGQPLDSELNKSVTVSTGLTYYDLQAPGKNLYPIITPLRNAIPRVNKAGAAGTATNWKSITALVGSGFDAMGWVPEGQRAGAMSYVTASNSAAYVTLGEEDEFTFEAGAAAQGFEDLASTVAMRLLQKTMRKEEIAILGGNSLATGIALGVPTTPTLSNNTSTGTIPAATYNVSVVALTQEGYMNSSVAAGVATTLTITGQDGKTFVLNGGSSNKSATAATVLAGTGQVFASTPVKNGAVAYAWFIGTAGAERLAAITTINSVNIQALNGAGQLLSAITADCSQNSLAFDGLLTTAFKAGATSSAVITALATGTSGTGTYLTASGAGSVTEIDTILKAMWDRYRVSPTVIYVNSQELKNITQRCLANGGTAPLLRMNTDQGGAEFVAGNVIAAYFNPYALNGGVKIPVKLHPDLAAGTILMYCENLPVQYQSTHTPQVAEMLCRRDYYAIQWPLTTRKYQFGVYAEEVLAVYAPFCIGILTNISNG